MNFILDFKIKSNPLGNSVWRPLLEITLSHGDRSVPCIALVDTGADISQFPLRIMRELGLEKLDTDPTVTASGKNEIHQHVVDIAIPSIREVGAFSAPVGFTERMDSKEWEMLEKPFGFLGQCGFLEHFKATFNYRQRRFYLEPYEPTAESVDL
jgi:hypothetical protein